MTATSRCYTANWHRWGSKRRHQVALWPRARDEWTGICCVPGECGPSAIISLHNRTHSSQMKIPPGPAISRCTRSRPFPQNEHAFGVRLLAIAKPLHRRIVVGAECWPRGTTVSPGRPHFLTNGLISAGAAYPGSAARAGRTGCRLARELLAHKPVEAQSGI